MSFNIFQITTAIFLAIVMKAFFWVNVNFWWDEKKANNLDNSPER